MNLNSLRNTLMINYQYPGIEEGWHASQKGNYRHALKFLGKDYLQDTFLHLAIPKNIHLSFLNADNIISDNDDLLRLFWHCRQELFVEKRDTAVVKIIPKPSNAMGEYASMFEAILALSSIEFLKEIHRTLNIPHDVTKNAFLDLIIWMNDYHKKYNRWGFAHMGWLLRHFRNKMFRLGRLQFIPTEFSQPYRVLQHVKTNQIVTLIENDLEFNTDGYIEGTNGIVDPKHCWTSCIIHSEQTIIAYTVSEKGYALNNEVSFDTNQWRCILDSTSTVLDIHIPEDGSLDNQLCRKSMQDALVFFKKYYPDINIKGFKCTSWLLDNQLPDILHSQSNIVQFQKLFNLFPQSGGDTQALERVFGSASIDISSTPQKTSLQKAFVKHHKNGGRFRLGGGYCMANKILI
jgi:hypothetical protein